MDVANLLKPDDYVRMCHFPQDKRRRLQSSSFFSFSPHSRGLHPLSFGGIITTSNIEGRKKLEILPFFMWSFLESWKPQSFSGA